jgi:hypothetical protein
MEALDSSAAQLTWVRIGAEVTASVLSLFALSATQTLKVSAGCVRFAGLPGLCVGIVVAFFVVTNP